MAIKCSYIYVVDFSQNKKRKILQWFEQIFASVSGDDQLLQVDEFSRALYINGVSGVHVAIAKLQSSAWNTHLHNMQLLAISQFTN